jgi:hypothetical protein
LVLLLLLVMHVWSGYRWWVLLLPLPRACCCGVARGRRGRVLLLASYRLLLPRTRGLVVGVAHALISKFLLLLCIGCLAGQLFVGMKNRRT